MGHLDQFAKDTFALETSAVTHGAVSWQLPPELGLSEVRLDGLLRVLSHAPLASLAPPWSLIGPADELVLEAKMQGDHLDLTAFDRAMLRRLARQIQRREDREQRFDGETLLWLVAAHVPAVIRERRPLVEVAPGCYRVGPEWMATFWIAANELPLADELVPFLIARTGKPLDTFVRWVKTRRPLTWLGRVLQCLPMSAAALDDLRLYMFPKTDDPAVLERRRMLLDWIVEASPGAGEKLEERGAIREARRALRAVLVARGLALGTEDDERIDACTDHDTLLRWVRQSAVATSTAEALR